MVRFAGASHLYITRNVQMVGSAVNHLYITRNVQMVGSAGTNHLYITLPMAHMASPPAHIRVRTPWRCCVSCMQHFWRFRNLSTLSNQTRLWEFRVRVNKSRLANGPCESDMSWRASEMQCPRNEIHYRNRQNPHPDCTTPGVFAFRA